MCLLVLCCHGRFSGFVGWFAVLLSLLFLLSLCHYCFVVIVAFVVIIFNFGCFVAISCCFGLDVISVSFTGSIWSGVIVVLVLLSLLFLRLL